MADKQPPKKRTPLVGKGDKTPDRKVGGPGTPNNPRAVVRGGKRKAEIIDPKHDPKNPPKKDQ
jgi:hypothetical protein